MLTSACIALFVTQTPIQPLRWNPVADGIVTGVSIVGWVASEVAKPALAPATCRWCEPNDVDTAFRRAFNPSLSPSASGVSSVARVSDVNAFVLLPLAMLGLDIGFSLRDSHDWRVAAVDVLLIAEAVGLTAVATQITKFSVGRARPYAVGADPGALTDGPDSRLSFFSGHASFSFSVATATATIMTLRGYRTAWLAWVIGLPLAVTTALLRVGADKHWLSDVVMGASVGSLVGVLVPWLFHRPLTQGPVTLRISGAPGGIGLLGHW
jgi:membrane-associated phospholipid phosphatase